MSLEIAIRFVRVSGWRTTLNRGDAGAAEFFLGLRGVEQIGRVRPAGDDFGSGLASDGTMHLVLHRLEKLQADLLRRVVINAGRVDVRDLLVKPPLGGADVLNPPRQFLEIIKRLVRILQPLVVEYESLDDVFPQPLRSPNAELRGHARFDPIADGNDSLEIVELCA